MLKNIGNHIAAFIPLLKKAMQELLKNDPLRMAGATAFFTTFALPPILVILIQVLKLVLDPRMVRRQLFSSLSDIVGEETVRPIRNLLRVLRDLADNWWITAGGFVFLLFVATTLFRIIKSSINQVWKIKAYKTGIVKGLKGRIQSVIVILLAGVLFVAGLFIEGLQAFVGRYIFEISPLLSFYFNSVFNYVFSIFIVTLWFATLFRFLPDGKPRWSVAFAGGLLTAILFNIGKLILHWLLSYSNINTFYGTSASVVLLLLFVFYSALILYFGAAFTKIWGLHKDLPIQPLPGAVHYKLIEAPLTEET
jgi:membrane protein